MCWHLPIFPDRHQSSIFGTIELNFRVRNGNGWTLALISTNCMIATDLRQKQTMIFSISQRSRVKTVVTRTGFEPMLTA